MHFLTDVSAVLFNFFSSTEHLAMKGLCNYFLQQYTTLLRDLAALLGGPTSESSELVRVSDKEAKMVLILQCLSIFIAGFSSNQYEGGNRVTFMNSNGNLTCDVISYRSSARQIECVTR